MMLVYQGARALEIWTGKKAPVDVMERAVREALAARRAGKG
jgi:shikimate dehydrogenase